MSTLFKNLREAQKAADADKTRDEIIALLIAADIKFDYKMTRVELLRLLQKNS